VVTILAFLTLSTEDVRFGSGNVRSESASETGLGGTEVAVPFFIADTSGFDAAGAALLPSTTVREEDKMLEEVEAFVSVDPESEPEPEPVLSLPRAEGAESEELNRLFDSVLSPFSVPNVVGGVMNCVAEGTMPFETVEAAFPLVLVVSALLDPGSELNLDPALARLAAVFGAVL